MFVYDLVIADKTTIIDLFIEDGAIHLVVWWVAVVGLLLLIVLGTSATRYLLGHRWQIVEVDIPLASIGKLRIRRTNEVVRIAHQAWTELVTRKAALPVDEEHDVIKEVYDSWYKLFGELRALTKSVPAEQLRYGGPAKELVDVLVRALNDGLRPHLTKWQARFRNWESEKSKTVSGVSPQELQQQFPDYDQLMEDLLEVNKRLVGFADALDTIVHGRTKGGSLA